MKENREKTLEHEFDLINKLNQFEECQLPLIHERKGERAKSISEGHYHYEADPSGSIIRNDIRYNQVSWDIKRVLPRT